MKVLVACEKSQEVCKAFRALGHEAYSCDLQEPSGGHPEWHILGDALAVLSGCCVFETMDGKKHCQGTRWDLLIAHPPCTYLSAVGTRHLYGGVFCTKTDTGRALRRRTFFGKFSTRSVTGSPLKIQCSSKSSASRSTAKSSTRTNTETHMTNGRACGSKASRNSRRQMCLKNGTTAAREKDRRGSHGTPKAERIARRTEQKPFRGLPRRWRNSGVAYAEIENAS